MMAMNAKMEISTALEDRTTSATWEDLGESKRGKKAMKNLNIHQSIIINVFNYYS